MFNNLAIVSRKLIFGKPWRFG